MQQTASKGGFLSHLLSDSRVRGNASSVEDRSAWPVRVPLMPYEGDIPLTTRLILAVAFLVGATSAAHAEGPANALGRAVGDFSAVVGQAAMQPLMDGQPHWVTIKPRPKADCLAESNGVINSIYGCCRRGRQEFTRFDSAGNRVVLSERAIPEWCLIWNLLMHDVHDVQWPSLRARLDEQA
jgi:hypothetical protein